MREGAAFGDLLEKIRGAQHAGAPAAPLLLRSSAAGHHRATLPAAAASRAATAVAPAAAHMKVVGRVPPWRQRNDVSETGLSTADGAFGEDKKLQAEFRQLVRSEMETAKALLKGKAIKEHMEDSYCEMVAVRRRHTLRKCMSLGVAASAVCADSR